MIEVSVTPIVNMAIDILCDYARGRELILIHLLF
jgi:hypothetical protein